LASFQFQRLLKGSFIYGFGSVLQRLIGVLLLPFFTRELTPADYGVISLVTLITAALTGVFNLGTANSMGILFFSEKEDEKRINIVFSTAFLLLCVSVLVIIILFLLTPSIGFLVFENNENSGLLQIAFITLGITTVSEPFLSYLRMTERAKVFTIISLGISLITTLLCILFVLHLHLGSYGFFLASFFGQLLLILFLVFFVCRKIKFAINTEYFKPLIKLGFPSIFGLFAFLLMDYSDRQILQRYVGLSNLGIYSVGYNFGMVIMLFVNAFLAAWPPFFMSFINKQDEGKLIFARTFRYYIIGFGFIGLFFFGFSKTFLTIIVAPDFVEAYTVVGLVAMGYILRGSYSILIPGLYFTQNLKYQSLIEWITAFINIALNFLLISNYGMLGAAFATLLSFFFLPFLTWLFTRKIFPIEYEYNLIFLAFMFITFAALSLFYLARFQNGILLIISVSGILMLTFLLLVKFCLKLGEINFALQILKKYVKKDQ